MPACTYPILQLWSVPVGSWSVSCPVLSSVSEMHLCLVSDSYNKNLRLLCCIVYRHCDVLKTETEEVPVHL